MGYICSPIFNVIFRSLGKLFRELIICLYREFSYSLCNYRYFIKLYFVSNNDAVIRYKMTKFINFILLKFKFV